MHENVPQPRVVDRVARRGSGRLGHGHRARGRDRSSPCPGAARRHGVGPAAGHARGQPGTVTVAKALAHRNTNTVPVTNAQALAHRKTVANAQALALRKTVADTQALAFPKGVAHPLPDAGTITVTHTHRRPIGAQQRSEPRGVH